MSTRHTFPSVALQSRTCLGFSPVAWHVAIVLTMFSALLAPAAGQDVVVVTPGAGSEGLGNAATVRTLARAIAS